MGRYTINHTIFEGAAGKIGPLSDDGPIVDGIIQGLESGELLEESDGIIPYRCIDGRYDEANRHGPRAAGGTLSIFVGDDLTNRHYTSEDISVVGGLRSAAESVVDKGYKVGAHSGAHSDSLGSGCAASDSLASIYGVIVSKPEDVRRYVEYALEREGIDEAIEQMIIKNAAQRTIFSHGKSLLDVVSGVSGAEIEDFTTGHHEVVSVINWRDGYTVSKSKIREKFGDDIGTFCVDAWALVEAAGQTATTPEAIKRMMLGLMYFNIASLLALASDNSRLIVVK